MVGRRAGRRGCALANAKLGVSGGWLQLLLFVERRPLTEPWRLWFTGGLVGGAVLAAVLGTGRMEPPGHDVQRARGRGCLR
ncbi:MAG: hypothetical protein ACXVXM_18810, partial [Nocardioidaceae bacterium]